MLHREYRKLKQTNKNYVSIFSHKTHEEVEIQGHYDCFQTGLCYVRSAVLLLLTSAESGFGTLVLIYYITEVVH